MVAASNHYLMVHTVHFRRWGVPCWTGIMNHLISQSITSNGQSGDHNRLRNKALSVWPFFMINVIFLSLVYSLSASKRDQGEKQPLSWRA